MWDGVKCLLACPTAPHSLCSFGVVVDFGCWVGVGWVLWFLVLWFGVSVVCSGVMSWVGWVFPSVVPFGAELLGGLLRWRGAGLGGSGGVGYGVLFRKLVRVWAMSARRVWRNSGYASISQRRGSVGMA